MKLLALSLCITAATLAVFVSNKPQTHILPELSLQRSAPDTVLCAGVIVRTNDCPETLRGVEA